MTSGDILEDEHQEQAGQRKRRAKTLHFIKSLRRRAGRLFLGFLFLAIVFASTAAVQHWFVHRQLYRTTSQELGAWALQIASEVAYNNDKWDLTGYRRASITAPSWYVVTRDGLVVDIEGFIPGVFGHVEQLGNSLFDTPATVATAIGEQWRLYAKKVAGGFVVVGICSPEHETEADAKLLASAAKFGSTLEEAAALSSRAIDFDVDYAVVSSAGEIKAAWGGIPLKTDPSTLPRASDHTASLVGNGKSYLLYVEPILDSHGRDVATVIVPKDMGLEQKALQAQDRFNVWIVGFAGLFAMATALWLLMREFSNQTKTVTLEEALRVGESRTIEFKSTFSWDVRQAKPDEERRLDVLKSIAGFLNTSGGTLFIGVTEDTKPPTVCGLEEDLKITKGNRDQLQRTLRDLITTRIGPEFSPFIKDSLEVANGQLCWIIVVEESTEPAFVRWKPRGQQKEEKIFFVREGPKTSDLDNESTWHYIKNKWG
jgi:hypothetical protein